MSTVKQKRIAMWSGPRNLSTALMYSFAARGDCAVMDEPFYAAYLAATGIDHPMAAEIINDGETDPASVSNSCLETPFATTPFVYQKHMTLHMVPEFDRAFMKGLTNVFLIRDPVDVILSYARKRENPTLLDIGFAQQAQLFDEVSDWMGEAPAVIDAADILRDPATMLSRLCDRLGLPYTDAMLHWRAGPKPFDGVWAPHWYNAVHKSTGFDRPDDGPKTLPDAYRALSDAARPFFDRLATEKLKP